MQLQFLPSSLGAEVKGFQLDYLAKVPEVKDTVHKHSLVYHLCTLVMDKYPDSTDLYSELGAVARCAKVRHASLALFHAFPTLTGRLRRSARDAQSTRVRLSWRVGLPACDRQARERKCTTGACGIVTEQCTNSALAEDLRLSVRLRRAHSNTEDDSSTHYEPIPRIPPLHGHECAGEHLFLFIQMH